jgi:hypothetical protein
LLEACQHDLVAVIHLSPAKTRYIAGAGIVALLSRSRGHHHDQWNEKKKPSHLVVPSCASVKAIKFRCARGCQSAGWLNSAAHAMCATPEPVLPEQVCESATYLVGYLAGYLAATLLDFAA